MRLAPARPSSLARRMFALAGVIAALHVSSVLAQDASKPASPAPGSKNHSPTPEIDRLADESIYRQHIFTLANPWFEGRSPGTRGNAEAARYIEFNFKKAGLKPAFASVNPDGTDGAPFSSYFQPFKPIRFKDGRLSITTQEVSLSLASKDTRLAAETDFRALGLSGEGDASGAVVFVGYAIEDGRDGYASFKPDTDLKGKIAVVLRFEPMTPAGKSKWADDGWSPSAALTPKIAALASRGAAAVILVNPPGASDARSGRLATAAETQGEGDPLKIPVVMLTEDAADRLVRAGDASARSLRDLRALADEGSAIIPLPNATARIKTAITREVIQTQNVGGVLPGKGSLASEFVVIGAHYDHVGYGDFGSLAGARGTIHPGADDNASGTSGLLLITKKLSAYYASLPDSANCRSLLFLAFSAEESGLEGSHFYCEHPILAIDKHYLMLNMDMIGRLRETPPMEITGVGSAIGLQDWLTPYFDNAGFKSIVKKRAPGNSDHASFFHVKVPIVFFFTGLHRDYHRPSDTADLINVPGAVQVVDLVHRITIDAVGRAEPLVFGEPKEPETPADAPMPPTATPQAPANPHGAGGGDQPLSTAGGKVRFGIMPGDYADDKPGVLIGEVFPDTPAAKAGLKPDDRITKWNGKDVKTVEEWTPLLRSCKPGDKVEITYTRDGKEATCTVTLEARKEPAGG